MARLEHLLEQLQAEHGSAIRTLKATQDKSRELVKRAKSETANRAKHPKR